MSKDDPGNRAKRVFTIRGTALRTGLERTFFVQAADGLEALQRVSKYARSLTVQDESAVLGGHAVVSKPTATDSSQAAGAGEAPVPRSMDPRSPARVNWFWPSSTWGNLLLVGWLGLSAAVGLRAGPFAAFLNAALWYLVFLFCRFVFLQVAQRNK